MSTVALDPTLMSHPVTMYGITFISPLHYLYYYIYAKDAKQRQKVLSTPDVATLMSYKLHLQEYAIGTKARAQRIYTLIAYLYMVYKDVREAMRTVPFYVYIRIPDDEHMATLYAKALLSFTKRVVHDDS